MDFNKPLPETCTFTGFSGCSMSAHYYNEEGSEMCWVQAITWKPRVDKDHNVNGYTGALVFVENIYEEPITVPKRFWVRIEARNEAGQYGVATVHHIELKEKFSGYDHAYAFVAQSKTPFLLQGE